MTNSLARDTQSGMGDVDSLYTLAKMKHVETPWKLLSDLATWLIEKEKELIVRAKLMGCSQYFSSSRTIALERRCASLSVCRHTTDPGTIQGSILEPRNSFVNRNLFNQLRVKLLSEYRY